MCFSRITQTVWKNCRIPKPEGEQKLSKRDDDAAGRFKAEGRFMGASDSETFCDSSALHSWGTFFMAFLPLTFGFFFVLSTVLSTVFLLPFPVPFPLGSIPLSFLLGFAEALAFPLASE